MTEHIYNKHVKSVFVFYFARDLKVHANIYICMKHSNFNDNLIRKNNNMKTEQTCVIYAFIQFSKAIFPSSILKFDTDDFTSS